jgi:hypothetical protein
MYSNHDFAKGCFPAEANSSLANEETPSQTATLCSRQGSERHFEIEYARGFLRSTQG